MFRDSTHLIKSVGRLFRRSARIFGRVPRLLGRLTRLLFHPAVLFSVVAPVLGLLAPHLAEHARLFRQAPAPFGPRSAFSSRAWRHERTLSVAGRVDGCF